MNDLQRHDRMNFPQSVEGQVFATVAWIFRWVAYVPVYFSNNCNDRCAELRVKDLAALAN